MPVPSTKFLLLSVTGWLGRPQQIVIEYLVEENRVLIEQIGTRRLRLNDDQRRRLAAKGMRLGRKALDQVASIVTPDTIIRWHRKLIVALVRNSPTRPHGSFSQVRASAIRMLRHELTRAPQVQISAVRDDFERKEPADLESEVKLEYLLDGVEWTRCAGPRAHVAPFQPSNLHRCQLQETHAREREHFRGRGSAGPNLYEILGREQG